LNHELDQTLPREHFGRFEVRYLKHINERVKLNCPIARDVAVSFMCSSSKGFGHNRFRSRLARQLKHVPLAEEQQAKIVETILAKFGAGEIDEQFIEQLRFALWLNREKTQECARSQLTSKTEYIQRYAQKVLKLGVSHVPKST